MSDAPERIYLQWWGDSNPAEGEPADEVTWCVDGIWDHDVEYVRADRIEALEAALAAADAWAESIDAGFASEVRPDIARADYMRLRRAMGKQFEQDRLDTFVTALQEDSHD